jgi:hypothetical protein
MDHARAQVFERAVGQGPVHAHQTVGVVIRECVEQHRFHHAEDGGIGADAKCQRENHNRCKAGTPTQRANCVTNIS